MPQCIAIVGGGPIGIAAALAAHDRGHDVTLFERGEVGASLRTWGATRFFTPLSMNATPRMLELLGNEAPENDALLTGPEMAGHVLRPLVSRAPLRQLVREHCEVLAIGRRGLTRVDYAGHPLRAERPFRLIVRNANGDEETLEADVLLDASGGLGIPTHFGAGGLPARGESRITRPLLRTLGDLHETQSALRGAHTLIVGHGHSAANALAVFEQLAKDDASTRVTWVVRTANRRPCEEIAGDSLPERAHVVARANALAEAPPPWLTVERRAMVEAVAQENAHFDVTLSGGRRATAQHIAAFTGYRPDARIVSELALELSPVTEGGARLHRAIANVTDCLSVPKLRAHDLESGEPNFYFIGSRAYGRARTFLLQNGFAQIDTILEGLR